MLTVQGIPPLGGTSNNGRVWKTSYYV